MASLVVPLFLTPPARAIGRARRGATGMAGRAVLAWSSYRQGRASSARGPPLTSSGVLADRGPNEHWKARPILSHVLSAEDASNGEADGEAQSYRQALEDSEVRGALVGCRASSGHFFQRRAPLSITSTPRPRDIFSFIEDMRSGLALALLCASAASSEVPAGRGLTRPSLAPSARSSVYASKPTLQAAKAVAAPTITPSFYWALLPNFLYFVSLSFSAWSPRPTPLHMLCPLIVCPIGSRAHRRHQHRVPHRTDHRDVKTLSALHCIGWPG